MLGHKLLVCTKSSKLTLLPKIENILYILNFFNIPNITLF